MRHIRLIVLSCIVVALCGCDTPEESAASHVEKAQELFDEGDYVNARLEARSAAQIKPNDPAARYMLALLAEQDGDFRRTLQHLQIVVEQDPDMLEAQLKLGTLYTIGQAYGLASQRVQEAIRLAPDDPDVLVLHARLLLQKGETEESLAKLDKVLAIEPVHVEGIGIKALAIHSDEPDRALALLDEAIGLLSREDSRPLRRLKLAILSSHERTQDLEQALLAMIEDAPDDQTYQNRLVRFYRDQGRMDEAEDMLRDLAAVASEDLGPRLNVVQFLAEFRAPEAAAAALQAFVEEDPENQRLKLVLGDLYLNNDRREEAMSIYQEIAAEDPLSEPGLRARAQLAAERLRNADRDGGEKLVAGILADSPAYPSALLMHAGLLFGEQRYDDAIVDLRVLLRQQADNQPALLLMARSNIAARHIILGKDAYRRLLETNPNHLTATRELIALMLQADEGDEAETVLEQLVQAAPGNIAAGVLMIELRVRQGDWQAAEAEARRLAAGTDPNGTGIFQVGRVLEGQQLYEEAVEAYFQALEKSPGNTLMLQGLARSLNAQGKGDEAIAFLRRYAAEKPDQPEIRLILGGALADQGRTPEALQVFESVITDYPALSPAYVAVAMLFPDDATKRIATYRRGRVALPGNMPISALLADEYLLLERIDELIELYEELHAADPENLEVTNNLAALLADYRYREPASLERAVQLADSLADSDNPLIMDTVGWVYHRNGDADRAVRYLERAVAATGEMPALRYHLGMAYLATGNRVGAKQELEKATRSADLDFEGLAEARETLATLN